MSTSKAIRSLIVRENVWKHLFRSAINHNSHKLDQTRCLSSLSGISNPSISRITYNNRKDFDFASGNLYNNTTIKRRFLGCGDGEEGGVLSKVYEERLVLGYSPEQLFDVVAAVDLYHGPKFLKTTASESNLFDHLINIWEFNPGPVPGSCDLYFFVDFKFQSPLYRQVASVFFKEVVSRLVGSFSERCRLIYGPGVPVIEKSYGEKA
ncbi:hypothetical protein OIU76_007500 [Salix suchowensis]|uniref:Coenzyme Q-binding protein COQ10 START domain-containing protein n=1 Tax=Salix suchowensis TaxID=1278906 RepID=A0ABQ9BYV0_9ROSI|nr:hypothetical protein OIU76_007500 [Salix suchowensis]KAJ6391169.1 hypothetical protein OIU77_025205 [Salix suchowensis]